MKSQLKKPNKKILLAVVLIPVFLALVAVGSYLYFQNEPKSIPANNSWNTNPEAKEYDDMDPNKEPQFIPRATPEMSISQEAIDQLNR